MATQRKDIPNRYRVPRHWRRCWAGSDFMAMAVAELGVWFICKKVLQIHETTLYRWLRGDTEIPMAAAIAIWYEMEDATRILNHESKNDQAALYNRVSGLEISLNEQIEKRARLFQIADFGCANDPSETPYQSPALPAPEPAVIFTQSSLRPSTSVPDQIPADCGLGR